MRGSGDGRSIAGGADVVGIGDEGQGANGVDEFDVGEGLGPVFGPSADVADLACDVRLTRPGEEIENGNASRFGDLFVGEFGLEVEGEALAVAGGEALGGEGGRRLGEPRYVRGGCGVGDCGLEAHGTPPGGGCACSGRGSLPKCEWNARVKWWFSINKVLSGCGTRGSRGRNIWRLVGYEFAGGRNPLLLHGCAMKRSSPEGEVGAWTL